jgi:hypothetical protein
MMVTALDTRALVEQSTSVGCTDEQAEPLTGALRAAQDIDLSNLATKRDLEIGLATKEAKLAETKAENPKWMFGAIGAQTAVIIGAVVTLTRAAGH